MGQNDDGSKGDELDLERARLISENGRENVDIPMCGFMSVRYYQPYFNVDTPDIISRIAQTVFYCRREQNFLAALDGRPDAYGPFWISTTLVFVVGVASHLNGWLSSWLKGATMEYNFQSILNASSMIYSFAIFAPAILWLIFRTYDDKLQYAGVLCLYGYSLFMFIPAALLCLVPSEMTTWLALLGAAVTSSVFLLRNFAPMVITHNRQQATILLGVVAITQVVFALCLKFNFFYEK